MADYSFFALTRPREVMPDDALPGISADPDVFCTLVEALHTALDTFQDAHADSAPLTFGDVIHAAKCFTHELIASYVESDDDLDDRQE